jgi:uncharacterized SAM-binding protein YcdF (DUF218 family)
VIIRGLGLGILVFLAAFFSLFLTAGQIYKVQDSFQLPVDQAWLTNPEVQKLNSIVVLAGARGRIAEAAQVWVDLKALYAKSGDTQSQLPILYLSGLGAGASIQTLEKLVKPEIFEQIDPERVLIENLSLNTVENARMLSRTVKERGWDHILLMTSSYHMRRARLIMEHVLGREIQIGTLSIAPETFDVKSWRDSQFGVEVTLQEYLKYLYFRNIL